MEKKIKNESVDWEKILFDEKRSMWDMELKLYNVKPAEIDTILFINKNVERELNYNKEYCKENYNYKSLVELNKYIKRNNEIRRKTKQLKKENKNYKYEVEICDILTTGHCLIYNLNNCYKEKLKDYTNEYLEKQIKEVEKHIENAKKFGKDFNRIYTDWKQANYILEYGDVAIKNMKEITNKRKGKK
ncbi:MAG: hypothetical protein ACRCUM_03845 [Mycoplasmoidaceae bacterium]